MDKPRMQTHYSIEISGVNDLTAVVALNKTVFTLTSDQNNTACKHVIIFTTRIVSKF